MAGLTPASDRAPASGPTPDHAQRLAAVMDVIRVLGARRVVDAGCGPGLLSAQLAAEPDIETVQALDSDPGEIRTARARLSGLPPEHAAKVTVEPGSIIDAAPRLAAFRPDLVALVEVIEHVDPSDLRRLEHAVFSVIGAPFTIITTPNAEVNAILGVPKSRFRHPDHKFEWTRAQFISWARRIAGRHRLGVRIADLVRPDPDLGGSSQMAVFVKPRGPQ